MCFFSPVILLLKTEFNMKKANNSLTHSCQTAAGWTHSGRGWLLSFSPFLQGEAWTMMKSRLVICTSCRSKAVRKSCRWKEVVPAHLLCATSFWWESKWDRNAFFTYYLWHGVSLQVLCLFSHVHDPSQFMIFQLTLNLVNLTSVLCGYRIINHATYFKFYKSHHEFVCLSEDTTKHYSRPT